MEMIVKSTSATLPFFAATTVEQMLEKIALLSYETKELQLPVLVQGRPDLLESIVNANAIYSHVSEPEPASTGVFVGSNPLLMACQKIWRPLAREWHDIDVEARLPNRVQYDDAIQDIVVVGLYKDIYTSPLFEILLPEGEFHQNREVSIITGRDAQSTLWMAAKQWGTTNQDINAVGVFSDAERITQDVNVYGTDQIRKMDVASTILEKTWRRVLFRGHAREHDLNLGYYTLCGRHKLAGVDSEAGFQPRCGYGYTCFKDEKLLISPSKILAVEMILSGCDTAAFSDTALYSSSYQLHLEAIDGVCKTLLAAPRQVPAAGRPENEVVVDAAIDLDLAYLLNSSLEFQSPYTTFLKFGMPSFSLKKQKQQSKLSLIIPDLISATDVLSQASEILSDCNVSQLIYKVKNKTDILASRNYWESERQSNAFLQSVSDTDLEFAKAMAQDADHPLLKTFDWFLARSRVDHNTTSRFSCTCKPDSKTLVKSTRSLISSYRAPLLTTSCFHCGAETFRFPFGPDLRITTPKSVIVGDKFQVSIELVEETQVPAHVTVVFPSWVSETLEISPSVHRLRQKGSVVTFSISVKPDTIPQAYHYTVAASRGTAVFSHRCRIKFFPAP